MPETTPPPPPRKKVVSFYDNVRKIPAEDWGKRAFIYGYCIEPVCNLKAQGENKYLFKSGAAILDEDGIMIDYGSGKYRLNLVYRKQGGDKGDEVDSFEFEIYNPKYPPKIPRSVWMNDPRNERWAALLPKEEPPKPETGLGTLTDAFRTFTDIRKDLREELTPPPGPPIAPPPPPTDPVEAGLRIANLMMTLKADNPMNEFYRDEMKALREELSEERRETRRLLSQKAEPTAEKFGIKEALAEVKEFLPSIKDLVPQVGEAVRAGRTNGWDILEKLVTSSAPTAIDYIGKISLALISRMPPNPAAQNGTAQPQAQIAAPAGTNGQPAAQTAQPANVPKFVHFLAQPSNFEAFQRYFKGSKEGRNTGADFAQWVFDGNGETPMKEARVMGSGNIMALLKQSPAWFLFKDDETKISEFIDQALAWQPPEEEGDEPEDDGNIDLTAKGV